jgi:hypothetical protein
MNSKFDKEKLLAHRNDISTFTWNTLDNRQKKARMFVCVRASLVRLPWISFHELLPDRDKVDHVMSLERDGNRPVGIQCNVIKPKQRPCY